MKKDARGFSLMEVMLAAGLMGGVALLSAAVMRMGMGGSKALVSADDARTVTSDIASVLTDSVACTLTMGGRNPTLAGGFSITQVRDRTNAVRYQTGTADRYGPSRLQLQGIGVGGVGTDARSGLQNFASTSSGQGLALVRVTLRKSGVNQVTGKLEDGSGPTDLIRVFMMNVTLDGANLITSCSAIGAGTSDEIWQRSTSNSANVFYNGGSVGIGTAEPNYRLTLYANNSTSGNEGITINTYDNSTNVTGGTFRVFASRGTKENPTNVRAGDNLGGFNASGMWTGKTNGFFETGNARAAMLSWATEDWSSPTNQGAALVFRTTANGTAANTDRMRIDHDGKVAIGTNIPSTNLHVYNESATAPTMLAVTNPSSGGSAGAAVTVGADSGRYIFLYQSSQAAGDASVLQATGSGGMYIDNLGTGSTFFRTSPSADVRMTITNGGNVGIGTTTPVEKLDLTGGNIKIGYERVTNTCSNTYDCTATCTSGKYVTGGGALCTDGSVTASFPNGDSAWTVSATRTPYVFSTGAPVYGYPCATINVYAICLNVR